MILTAIIPLEKESLSSFHLLDEKVNHKMHDLLKATLEEVTKLDLDPVSSKSNSYSLSSEPLSFCSLTSEQAPVSSEDMLILLAFLSPLLPQHLYVRGIAQMR